MPPLEHPHITGQAVLVTGAGGSIGSALCARVLALRPARLVMINLTESGLAVLEQHLPAPYSSSTSMEFVLGNVLDVALLRQWMPGVHTVIHAAAYKYVPVCERNPAAAVLNNVGGTRQVCEVALRADVSRCLLISTDKAVNPVSVMGATKYLAERLIGALGPRFLTVRFGNVMDSAGSVLPLWREQIARGGPVTVTHPACERYFMTIDDACMLILGTLALDDDHGTFVFDMGRPRNLLAMAEDLIAQSRLPCRVHFIGLRPGDKVTEELYSGERQPTAHPRIFRVETAPPLLRGDRALVNLLCGAQEYDNETTRRRLMALVEDHV